MTTHINLDGLYVQPRAVTFGAEGGDASYVTVDTPLPVISTSSASRASGVTPLVGTMSASGTAGPFTPVLNRAINLTLGGTWTGTAQLVRSIDAGATKTPLTAGGQAYATYTGNINEPVWTEYEAGASYYLVFTRTSGSLTYRLAQ